MYRNTSGDFNIAIGATAMSGPSLTGNDNIAIGRDVMDALEGGACNIAIGKDALGATSTSSSNIAIGKCAFGTGVMTGDNNNIAIGTNAGCLQQGNNVNNTFVGAGAGQNVTTGSQLVALGKYALCNSDFEATTHANIIQLGDQNILCFLVACPLSVPSDCRDKTDVSDLDLGLDYIKALRPVYYRWDKRGYYFENGINNDEDRNLFINYKSDGSKKKPKWEVGLLAQEALAAEKEYTSKRQVLDPEFGIPDADEGILVGGTYKTSYKMSYEKLVPPLIKAVQELDAENTALKARVTTLEGG